MTSSDRKPRLLYLFRGFLSENCKLTESSEFRYFAPNPKNKTIPLFRPNTVWPIFLRFCLSKISHFWNFEKVTNGERPSWLTNSDRISIISHWDIFKYKTALPVFNSNAIEMNLHRIPNLTQKYIYLNDDLAFTGIGDRKYSGDSK